MINDLLKQIALDQNIFTGEFYQIFNKEKYEIFIICIENRNGSNIF